MLGVNVFRLCVDDALVIVSPPCEMLGAVIRFASCQLLQPVNGACVSSSVSVLTQAHMNAHDNLCDTVGEAS